MRTPIRLRLSFSHLLVLIIGMALAGILVWLAVEKVYINFNTPEQKGIDVMDPLPKPAINRTGKW